MKIVYLTITVGCVIFHILYKGDLSFVLMVFVLALPLVLFAALAVGTALMKIDAVCDETVTEKGKPAAVKINIRNRFFVPVSSCEIRVRYSTTAPFENGPPTVYTASVPLGGGTTETISLSFLPSHCGKISVRVKYAKLRDLLGVTSLRKKIDLSTEITVLPRVFPISARMESRRVYNAEGSVFSKEKPGDDPSEIFMLREYRDGDRLNLIHWKLSSRSENFIVKELSKPVDSKILIIADPFGCRTADGIDRILETAASISGFLSDNGIAHTFLAPHTEYKPAIAEIKDTDSFYANIASMAADIGKLDIENGIACVMEIFNNTFISGGGFSRVLAVSECDGEAYTDKLTALCGEARLTVVCTCVPPKGDGNKANPSAVLVYADAEGLSSEKEDLSI